MTRSSRTTVRTVRTPPRSRTALVALATLIGSLVFPVALAGGAAHADPDGDPATPAVGDPATPTAGAPAAPAAIVGHVAGTVTDARCGLPLDASELHLVFPAAETWQSAASSATGAFAFDVVAGGAYILLAAHAGYENGWAETSVADGATSSVAVILTRDATATPRDCTTGEHPEPAPAEGGDGSPDGGTGDGSGSGTGDGDGSGDGTGGDTVIVPTDTPSTPSETPTPTGTPGAQGGTAQGGSAAQGDSATTSQPRAATRRSTAIRPIEIEPPTAAVDTPSLDLPTVPDHFGDTTASLLAQFRAETGLAAPPALAELFGIADLAAVDMSDFTAWMPWPAEDTAVEVWSYSWPVYVGTFPVVGNRAGLIGLDLEALGPGSHHLVIRGADSGEYRVASFANAGRDAATTATTVDRDNSALPALPVIDPWTRVAWIFGIAALAIVGVLVTAGILARKYREKAEHRA